MLILKALWFVSADRHPSERNRNSSFSAKQPSDRTDRENHFLQVFPNGFTAAQGERLLPVTN